MVSESILSFIENDSPGHKMFKKFEYKAYKRLHRDVLGDQGFPTLKKRAYMMPGYKRVLDKEDRTVYEKGLKKQQKKRIDKYAM